MAEQKLKVLIADDHAMVRAGVRRLLEDTTDITVIAEVETGEAAYQAYFKHQPDVVIMDINMPGIGGLEALRRIKLKDDKARILILSVHEDVVFPTRVLQAGALGYLTKRAMPDALLRAIATVYKGETFIERDVAQKMVVDRISGESDDPFNELSEREFEVFRMLAEGNSVLEIANALFLSPKTVGTYQTRIMRKLDVPNSAALTRLAIRKGFIEP